MSTADETDPGSLSPADLQDMIACPACASSVAFPAHGAARCTGCGRTFPRLPHAFDFVLPDAMSSPLWDAWEVLQHNGEVSYEQDPEHNLGVGAREDYLAFARFCGLSGTVLDVGCGPQPWPTHFEGHAPGTRFIGVDPLVGGSAPAYTQLRALGEHLPFRPDCFDHVVFATTLDHFVDPLLALNEAARVVRATGRVEIWVGHKDARAPSPALSPDWYQELTRPDGAEDVFHIKRLGPAHAAELFGRSDLVLMEEQTHQVDAWRSNHFYRLARRDG